MRTARILWVAFITGFLGLFISGCSQNDLYSELPSKIENFIVQYYPGQKLESVTVTTDIYHVKVKGGPGFVFSKDCAWESVNGYGSTLPQVFLFDQLPPALYKYLQETDCLNNVYAVVRDSKTYTVTLKDYTIVYDIATNDITGKYAPEEVS